jgi:hypothetical protein
MVTARFESLAAEIGQVELSASGAEAAGVFDQVMTCGSMPVDA